MTAVPGNARVVLGIVQGRDNGHGDEYARATLVGERGVSLSGGQRQRLAIARGVLPESSVIVFDDSTAAVDAATDMITRYLFE